MRLLLHAITTSDLQRSDENDLAGLGGRRLVRIEAGSLVAWASEFDRQPSVDQFTRADLLEHHEIISRLHAQVDACLPARFATWLSGDADLKRRARPLTVALERVRGRAELAITALWTSPVDDDGPPLETTPTEATTPGTQPEVSTPGTRYLRAPPARVCWLGPPPRASPRELADEIERTVGDELVEATRSVCPSPTVALSAALLVPRAAASELKNRLLRERPGVRILVNGPWPPYTFADVVMEE